jgi:protein-disulfide isomerase
MALAGGATLPARAQGITAKQADELIQQNREVLNELKQIHQLMERQQAGQARPAAAAPPPDDKVHVEIKPGAYSIGRADAPLTIVEYTDFQCPFCRQFHLTAYADIKKNYIDTGKVRYVSRDFPLAMHENARRAAVAGRCAGEQGKYWELRDVMIANANQLRADNLVTYARDLGLDVPKFSACLDSDRFTADIDRNIAEGQKIGVSGTPSFVIGHMSGDKLDGVRLVGAMPYSVFDAKLKELLAKPGA